MQYRERLKRALETSRGITERMLADIKQPEQWMATGVKGANHALWIVGHLAVADDAFISMTVPKLSDRRNDYRAQFGKGSQPVDDFAAYDSPDVLMKYFRERREALLAALAELPEEDFTKPLPENAPPVMYDYVSVFHMAAWHESLHAGQLSMIRRSLGFGPLV